MNIVSYLKDNNIAIGDENFYIENTYSNDEKSIKKQIDLIIEVQNILKNQKNTFIPRVESNIGKELENFKVSLKRIVKNIELLRKSKELSEVDIFILEQGENVILKGQKALKGMCNNEYIELIKRSMSQYEICIGRVDEGNIIKDSNGIISIRNTKYMSYNLLEHDIYNYIKRIKRRGYTGSIEELIRYYLIRNSFEEKSYSYLKVLVNLPIDELRVLTKYFIKKKNKTTNQWVEEMNIASKNYGKELS